MARALSAALALCLLAAACGGGSAPSPSPAADTGPRSYALLAWFDDQPVPSLVAAYRLDRGARTSDGGVYWGEPQREVAWITSAVALYVAAPDGRVGSFDPAEAAALLDRWPLLAGPTTPDELLDPETLAARLTDCTRPRSLPDLDWSHPDPIVDGASLTETLQGGEFAGLCDALPLRGQRWHDASGRTRLLRLELPGLRFEWSDLGPGPEPLLFAPAAAPQHDLAAFLGLR